MDISLNTSKYLSESTWKLTAAKHKVKDNGLSRALSDCTKQIENDEYDLVLKSLAQVTVLVGKLKAEKTHASNRDVCHYLENVTKEVAKLRVEVAAEKKDCAESEAADAKEEADEVKLAKAIGVELAAGLQKAKKTECGVLVGVASPVYGVMVAARLSTQHKAKLTDLTGCKQFLPMGYCIWDDDKRAYYFIMQRKDTSLVQPLQDAIKYYASISVKVLITTRAEYDKLKEVPEESYTDKKEEEENPYESEDDGGGEDLQDARRPIESEDEPLLTGVRPFDIGGSVGQGGKNAGDDVQQVQTALNRKGASLNVDGKIGSRTIQAIRDFQKKIGIAYPDGLVEVGKKTAAALAGNGSAAQYAGSNSGGAYGGGSNGGGYGGSNNGGGYGGNKGGSSYGGGNKGGGAYGGGSNGGGTYGGGSSSNYGGNSGGNYGSKGGSTYGGGQYSGGGNTGYGGSGADYGYSGSSGGAAGAALGGGNQQSGRILEQSGAAQPQEGFLEHAGNAAENVYEQRKEQAKGVVDSIEEALLPDNNVIGEGPLKEG